MEPEESFKWPVKRTFTIVKVYFSLLFEQHFPLTMTWRSILKPTLHSSLIIHCNNFTGVLTDLKLIWNKLLTNFITKLPRVFHIFSHSRQWNSFELFFPNDLRRNSCFIHCNETALNSFFPNDIETKFLLHSLQWNSFEFFFPNNIET